MNNVNLLEYLNNVKSLYALDYATNDIRMVNLLDLMLQDEQFVQKKTLGVLYLDIKTLDQVTIVDGLSRVVSLSLLLHAVCECYKKTSTKNDSAIKTIRTKYLLNGERTKLRLSEDLQIIYDKIIFGERLSGKEKESAIFKILHSYWSEIKSQGLKASKILKMLNKIFVLTVDVENVSKRDLYYTLNKQNKNIAHIKLIENYMKNIGLLSEWNSFKSIFNNNDSDIKLFFKDYFTTKMAVRDDFEMNLYEIFVNYFETMLQFLSEDLLITKIKRTAKLYWKILNLAVEEDSIKKALIQIKMHDGYDTYAYILNIYEDFIDNNISETTFLEILVTIDEYLRNRLKTPNNVTFNELINYLNAFITCK